MAVVYYHRVRYHEVDQQGYLFNARYLEIADVALTEFFRHLGWPYSDLMAFGVDPSVVSTEVSYRRPVRFDDEIEVAITVTRVGTSSFVLHNNLSRDTDLMTTITNTYVNVDAKTDTARALPDAVAEALRSELIS